MTLHPLRWLTLACLLVSRGAFAQAMVCPQLAPEEELSVPAPADDRLHLSADQADITGEGLSTLAGTVRLVQGPNRIETQGLSFDRKNQLVHIDAESVFRNRDLILRSKKADFDLNSETGSFQGANFTLISRSARGEAERVDLAKAGTVDVHDVYYTTCAPGSKAWFLKASEIELDRNEGLGTAKNARLSFGYVPILYFPWFRFPIDDRRRTGLLFPTIGNSNTTGFDARVPLYLNLAPNYDAELTPRYMSKRGTQIGSEGRYLFKDNTGRVIYEFLDHDRERDAQRSYFSFDHQGLLADHLGLTAKYGEVSDVHYFEDLGGRLEDASITHLERSAQLTYAAPAAYTVMGRVTSYQTVSEVALADPNCSSTGIHTLCSSPYQRLPEVRVDALTRKAKYGIRLGMSGEYVNFVRDPGPQGQRMDLSPYLRFISDHSAYYIGSEVDLHHTRYVVTDPTPGTDPRPTRTIPQYSAEGGLRFERITDGGDLQTLEPRLYYLYVPYREQRDLPLFDTGEPDFDFVQLFANNRFSGLDRIADANHVALAFTSRLLDPDSGEQRFSASLGQIFRFATPQVGVGEECSVVNGETVCPFSNPDKGGTDFVAELNTKLPANLNFGTTGQWSPVRNEFVRGGAALRWREGSRQADLVYRYREEIPVITPAGTEFQRLEQFDLSAATPLFGPVSMLGRWRYSVAETRTLETLAGLGYETCCWAIRGAARRYQFNTAQEYTTGVYFQLELKGLTKIGSGFKSLLPPLD